LIREWRSEIAEQWPPGGVNIDAEEMVALLRTGEGLGWDPQMVLWVVLNAEWLFRARAARADDVEAELVKIRDALLMGSSDPNHAVLVEQVAWPALRRELRRRRFLVSYRAFTVPSASLLMRFARGSKGVVGSVPNRTLPIVRVRRGPISKLGPIIAGLVVQGIAERASGQKVPSDHFGRALSELLLKRTVLLPEFRKWKAKLRVTISDPRPGLSERERRTTLRDWLVFRFERHYRSMSSSMNWEDVCQEAARNPVFVFTALADLEDARSLYALTWG
jgi:hypothetical protein